MSAMTAMSTMTAMSAMTEMKVISNKSTWVVVRNGMFYVPVDIAIPSLEVKNMH